ncbi:putative autotransporter adhesin-like protein [Arcicella aurantiaca]|uniref:Putative autotransporter adhesin-like protein n=1 Tax=Arcicella aurantiaca TaxID=591202 RepID=A0A316E868_9BACT|nr:head GIN domain-containing protein [Arcicella aurantiaca]PWK26266.1 putative autotransporter adhesin-like protein [Arcicella aurantiaca]
MKNLLKTSLILLMIILNSCIIKIDNDPLPLSAYYEIRQSFNVPNFNNIKTGSAFKINVIQGNYYKVTATGDETDIDDLDLYVRNGTLYGGYRNNARNKHYTMRIDITVPSLSSVEFSGATTADVSGFYANTFDVILSGASKLFLDIDASKLYMDISGSSQFTPSGDAQKIIGEISGASLLNTLNFPSDEMDIKVSGASSARVDVYKYLKVNASGASRVRYRGNPTTTISTSGASTVERD